ncbi:MAG: glycosyltransferase family 2 protein [Lysobacter sp.]|nr:glycosyltransferase family 2 protein [Lysobacter sp.]
MSAPTRPSARIVAGRVSIVLPAWNASRTVAAAVESCLAQTWGDVEVVVVNDGSTDDTRLVLESFGDRIRLLDRRNGGVAAARNSGVRVATGEFIAWMDNDDIAEPERISLGVAVLQSRSDVTVVCSDFSGFVSPDIEIERSHCATYYSAIGRLGGMAAILPERAELPAGPPGDGCEAYRTGDAYELLLEGNFVHPPTTMFRRRDLDRVGFLDERLRYASEYELSLRLARLGRVAFIERPLLRYRRAETQLSSYTTAVGKIERETVYVMDKVFREDPAVGERRRDLFRRRIRTACVEAAAGIGAADRRVALGLLARGVSLGAHPAQALRALAKIVIPPRAVAAVKGRLARNAPTRSLPASPAGSGGPTES